jgi:hypothetical protein
MNTWHRHWKRVFRGAAFLGFGFAALLFAAPAAAGSGDCVKAYIDEPIILPDGSLHPPGVLKICVRQHSPSAGMHKTSVDGRAIGEFQSLYRPTRRPSEDPRPVLVFEREPERGLALLGYTIPGRERTAVYWLEDARKKAGRHDLVATAPRDLVVLMRETSREIRLFPGTYR